jgi:hypothetical protein
MPEPPDDVERVIAACIAACVEQNAGRGPDGLARAILDSLWEAGYEVTRRPDMIPIRSNSGEQ